MSVMKYKDPSTGEIKKVFAPTINAYTKTETNTLLDGKAPAGFGLGILKGEPITDCNEARRNGWYHIEAGGLNSPDSSIGWTILVNNTYNEDTFIQDAWTYVATDRYYHMRRFAYPNSGTPWEWVDPQMIAGVVYRTTERHLGKSVYKKMDSNGVIWWSTDQETWKKEAERVGAPLNLEGIAFLGENPITSTTDDTTANWDILGSGYAWYNTKGQLNDQPSQYGFLINYVKRPTDIFQIWNTQQGGPTYFRSGDATGWSNSWRKVYDSNNKPTLSEIGASLNYGGLLDGIPNLNEANHRITGPGWFRILRTKGNDSFLIHLGHGYNSSGPEDMLFHVCIDRYCPSIVILSNSVHSKYKYKFYTKIRVTYDDTYSYVDFYYDRNVPNSVQSNIWWFNKNGGGCQAEPLLLSQVDDAPSGETIVLTQDVSIIDSGNVVTSGSQLYTYGTSDLTAGSSSLETGKLYFVYE